MLVVNDPQLTGLVMTVNYVGLKVFFVMPEANALISPVCIAHLLGMLLLGARGSTEATLRAFLLLDKHKGRTLQTLQMSARVRIKKQVRRKYRRGLITFYHADIDTNSTVAAGKVPDPVDGDLVALSTIRFKGAWKFESTKLGRFLNKGHESVLVPKLKLTGNLRTQYYADMNARVAELPGGRAAMYIFLPQGHLRDVEEIIAEKGIDEYVDNMEFQRSTLLVPRAAVEDVVDLETALKTLGVRGLFSKDANFSAISKGIRVTRMTQRTSLYLDQTDSEASVASGVALALRSVIGRKTLLIDVDRPFFFVIRDRKTGVDLFLGRITRLDSEKRKAGVMSFRQDAFQ
ncbi:neuroserpin-like [Ornithodoros turicata]|uniref:neuroserpin-like n=1 Tax=Ornithodoros turicata TaxID=34597 RepID=UPI0031395D89